MRDVLIRYLLGELNADEHEEVQARLHESPELRQELSRLRACIAAHQNDDAFDAGPPTGLAARTAERVTSGDEASKLLARQNSGLVSAGDPPAGILGWSLADLTVAGGVMLAVSMLLFPALRNSRDDTRRLMCQDNLHHLYVLGATFAENNGGLLPPIREKEHAGGYVLQLIGRGYVDHRDIALWLVCPDSPFAAKMREEGREFTLPNAEQVRVMTKQQFAEFSAKASPCYAYILPHRNKHKYCFVKNDQSPMSPVFSDASGDEESGTMTPNHGGRAVVQFAGGNHKSFSSWKLPGVDDDMSHNNRGLVAAGMEPRDIVLGNSSAMPGEESAEPGR